MPAGLGHGEVTDLAGGPEQGANRQESHQCNSHARRLHPRSVGARMQLEALERPVPSGQLRPVAPGWPVDPDTVADARRTPTSWPTRASTMWSGTFTSIVDSALPRPILIGHSFGGLIAEKLLGLGNGVAAVAIDPAQIKGVLPLPLTQLRAALPVLGNPSNLHKAVSLTEAVAVRIRQRPHRRGVGRALRKWILPAPAPPLFQAAVANFTLHSRGEVDTDNDHRGPLLLIAGTADHTVPDWSPEATLTQYRNSTATTELITSPTEDTPSRSTTAGRTSPRASSTGSSSKGSERRRAPTTSSVVRRVFQGRIHTSPIHQKENLDGHDHHQGRHRDLLQGLGQRPAGRLQPRLAAERRRLGRPDVPRRRQRLPRHRARPPRPRPLRPAVGRQRPGHLRRRPGRADRGARPARRGPGRPLHRRRRGRPATSAATAPRASPRPCWSARSRR